MSKTTMPARHECDEICKHIPEDHARRKRLDDWIIGVWLSSLGRRRA